MITCQKKYENLPFAHRQHKHDGHCALIHGHNWSFEFTFAADVLDRNGFVVDFGKLGWLKEWLESQFDHTLVLNEDDPLLGHLQKHLIAFKLANIVVVPNGGAEGLAQWVLEQVNGSGADAMGPIDWVERGIRVIKVTVAEDSKNAATHSIP